MPYKNLDEKLLLDIFKIAAPSNKEDAIRNFIIKFLTNFQIPFFTDRTGNIFNIDYENQPLLSAHMDTVQKDDDCELTNFIRIISYEHETTDKKIIIKKILRGLGIIGGDDKCGIYIILEILKKHKNINFIFSVGEECGCTGISAFVKNAENKKKLDKCLYGLILDRRFSGNIICEKNTYGTKTFEDALQEQLKDFGYKPEVGASSDANYIREFMSCANLSVGYYEPHSIREYVVLEYLLNTLNGVESTITNLKERFSPPEIKTFKEYKTKRFGNISFGTYFVKCDCCNISSYTTKLFDKNICSFCLRELNGSLNEYFSKSKKKDGWWNGDAYYDEHGRFFID
jgi:acetylornithine deacetylase/succinyl-diaminopimelate desuccinylase-like protein